MSSPVIDPIELLTDKGDRQKRFLTDIYNPLGCALFGFGLAMFLNWGFRRPAMSGIQKHIGFTAIGGALGYIIDGKRTETLAKRDAVFRHYIELHPEDFPPVERKKYADVLELWVPIR